VTVFFKETPDLARKEERKRIAVAVQRAMQTGLRTQIDDHSIRFVPISLVDGTARNDRLYLLVEVTIVSGASATDKTRVMRKIFDNLKEKNRIDEVEVRINEIPRENWAVNGVFLTDTSVPYLDGLPVQAESTSSANIVAKAATEPSSSSSSQPVSNALVEVDDGGLEKSRKQTGSSSSSSSAVSTAASLLKKNGSADLQPLPTNAGGPILNLSQEAITPVELTSSSGKRSRQRHTREFWNDGQFRHYRVSDEAGLHRLSSVGSKAKVRRCIICCEDCKQDKLHHRKGYKTKFGCFQCAQAISDGNDDSKKDDLMIVPLCKIARFTDRGDYRTCFEIHHTNAPYPYLSCIGKDREEHSRPRSELKRPKKNDVTNGKDDGPAPPLDE